MPYAPTDHGAISSLAFSAIVSPTSTAENIYHHHPSICKVGSRLFASFTSHKCAEDARGMEVDLITSDNGFSSYSSRVKLFESPDAFTNQNYDTTAGMRIVNAGFITVASGTYALGFVTDGPRTALREPIGVLYRKMDTTLGTTYLLTSYGSGVLTGYSVGSESSEIVAALSLPENLPQHWYADLGFGRSFQPDECAPVFTPTFREPSSVLLSDGRVLRFWRCDQNEMDRNVWYQQIIESGQPDVWSQTEIPNDPARGCLLRLSDVRILFIGNFVAGNSRKKTEVLISDDDGATWGNVWTLKSNTTTSPSIAGPTGLGEDHRGGSWAYHSAIQDGTKIRGVCSNWKERIIQWSFDVSEIS